MYMLLIVNSSNIITYKVFFINYKTGYSSKKYKKSTR